MHNVLTMYQSVSRDQIIKNDQKLPKVKLSFSSPPNLYKLSQSRLIAIFHNYVIIFFR